MSPTSWLCALLLALPLQSPAEDGAQAPVVPDAGELVVTGAERSLVTLDALRDSRESKLAELNALRAGFTPDLDSEQRLELVEQVRAVQQELSRIDYDFQSVATGIDVRAFDLGTEQEFDLMGEVENLVKPIVSELREATAEPREMERLRSELKDAEEHLELAREARTHLEGLIEDARTAPASAEFERDALVSALSTAAQGWNERVKELENQRTVAQFQLDQRLAQRKSVLDSTRGVLADFFRARGLHLLLSVAVFFAVLLLLRGLYRLVMRALRRRGGGERKFYARLVDVLYFGLSGLAALGGALIVLYSAGDWAMLGVAILALLGLAWASKAAIPLFFEQIRLLLNLGAVKEGERLIYDGLPWRVARLSMGVLLVNPELSGGRRRVPLRDMTSLRSRPSAKDEPWFPTQSGDWVLYGERLAKVVDQTPEHVRLEFLGGSGASVPSTDFLGAGAERLSGGFRVKHRFGIDYAHQATCTTEVPTRLRAHVFDGLRALLPDGGLRHLKVEFLEAGASSLDYALLADFEGQVAPRYNELERALQRLAVDACNAEGWGIPFSQVTVHMAAAD
ncbi:MAG: hypothetical protein H6828_12140 [Planctomycetes bacterium]|nr:hypothetical protein [Planctomycetota bacterium]